MLDADVFITAVYGGGVGLASVVAGLVLLRRRNRGRRRQGLVPTSRFSAARRGAQRTRSAQANRR